MGPSSYATQGPATHPLRVTRHWRSPSFRKMSTTVSIGVVSDRERAEVQDTPQLQRLWAVGRQFRGSSVKYMAGKLFSCLCLAFSGMGQQDSELHKTPV